MSQLRTLRKVVDHDESDRRRISLYPGKEPKRASAMSLLERGGRQAEKRLSFAKIKPDEDSSDASGLSDEETGSEDWDAGGFQDNSADEENSPEEDLPLAPRLHRQTMRTQNFVDRLKAKRSSKSEFGFHVNLSFKAAVFVVLSNLPMLIHPLQLLMPENFWPMLPFVGLYMVITFWKTLGDTIAYSFQGVAGVSVSFMAVTMTTTLIGGTTPETNLQYCFVWLNFATFIGMVLWLNIETNTRNVALSTHVSCFMSLLKPADPGVEKNMMKSFCYEEILKFRVEVVQWTVVFVGTLMALLAAALPLVPVLPSTYVFRVGDAMRYAEQEVEDLAQAMGNLVLDAVKGFGAQSESLVVDSFIAQAEHMHTRLQKLDSMNDAAWWEVSFPGSGHRKVRLRVIKEMHDILLNVLDNVIILLYTLKYEDFQDSHQEMMDEIEVPLEDLAHFFTDELNKAVETLTQSHSDDWQQRKDVLRQKKHLITEVGEAYMRTLDELVTPGQLAVGFDTSRSTVQRGSLFQYNEDADSRQQQVNMLYETMEESHFVYRLILMTDRLVKRLERQDVSADAAEPRCSLLVLLINHLTNPDVLFNQEHIMFAVRQTITIVVSFIICMQYYDYSPTMAVTQSLLVVEGDFTGSLLKRNMARFQGVVIGTIFPHLFFDWFSECTLPHQLTLMVILFLFEWLALYVYYSSDEYGYVAILVGAFGAASMCRGCGKSPQTMKILYLVMEQNAVGIALLTIVDLVFAPERASDLANHMMSHMDVPGSKGSMGNLPLLQHGLSTALNLDPHPEEQEDVFQPYSRVAQPERFCEWNMKMIRQLRKASKLCEEAYAEPRYMRRAWPQKFYHEAVMVCQGLRVDIIALNDSIGMPYIPNMEKQGDLNFNKSHEFRKFVGKMVKSFSTVSNMVRLTLKHFDEESGEHSRRQAEIHTEAKLLKLPTDEDIARLSKAVMNQPDFWRIRRESEKRRLSVRSHILADTFCRTSVAICVLKNITRRLQRLHTIVVDCV